MKTIILTDDTRSQLPPHNRWSNRFGRGFGISNNPEILTLLKKGNASIPADDLENENKYKDILHDFMISFVQQKICLGDGFPMCEHLQTNYRKTLLLKF